MPAVALLAQQSPYIHFTAATGPVDHYEARVRTLAETVLYLSPDATPVVEIGMLPVEPHWIDVRAVAADHRAGPWSDYTPHTADCDENGGVGFSDYRCRESWVDWLMHYGDRTAWDERLEVRRYE
jgi:hypothetical protein